MRAKRLEAKECKCIWFESLDCKCRIRFEENCPLHRMDAEKVLKERGMKPRKPKC